MKYFFKAAFCFFVFWGCCVSAAAQEVSSEEPKGTLDCLAISTLNVLDSEHQFTRILFNLGTDGEWLRYLCSRKHLEGIRTVTLDSMSRFSAADLECLKALPDLKELQFTQTFRALTEQEIAVLAALPKLETLFLYRTPLEQHTLRPLKQLPRLKKLSIIYTTISSENAEYLGNVKTLEELKLSMVTVPDQMMKIIGNMSSLHYLNLHFNGGIKEQYLVFLKPLKHLISLEVDSIKRFTWDVFKTMEALKLQRLKIHASNMDVELSMMRSPEE